MKSFIRNNISFLAAVSILLFCVTSIEIVVLTNTHWTIAYPLDDTFIHMALAKNIAFHGNWGINGTEFGSASSSPLYSVILSVFFKLFGTHTSIPLILNIVAAVFLLYALDKWLKKNGLNTKNRFFVALAAIIFTPLPVLVISGMEHTLQCVFVFLFFTNFLKWLYPDENATFKSIPVTLLITAMCLISIRYEDIFIVFIACLFLLFRKKIKQAFLLGGIALIPVIVFGLYSVSKGSYFLPNSVLLKADRLGPGISGLFAYLQAIVTDKLTVIHAVTGSPSPKPGISQLASQQLLLIIPVLYLFFRRKLEKNEQLKNYFFILFMTVALHLTFAATGWFYRYEGYLFFATTILIGTLFCIENPFVWKAESLVTRVWAVILTVFLMMPVGFRSIVAFVKAKRACLNIYEQQYQMGSFLHKFYEGVPAAVNDIGAVSFMTNSENLDLWGLGSIEVARSKKNHTYNPDFLDRLTKEKKVKLAVIYDSWFTPDLLSRWKRVATWTISDNVICGDSVVTFYAIDQDDAVELGNNLKHYESALPKEVKVSYNQF